MNLKTLFVLALSLLPACKEEPSAVLECPDGSEGCLCAGPRKDSCSQGLVCSEEICERSGSDLCVAGSEGCPCAGPAADACSNGLSCQEEICEQDPVLTHCAAPGDDRWVCSSGFVCSNCEYENHGCVPSGSELEEGCSVVE